MGYLWSLSGYFDYEQSLLVIRKEVQNTKSEINELIFEKFEQIFIAVLVKTWKWTLPQVPYSLVCHKMCLLLCQDRFVICTFQNQPIWHDPQNRVKHYPIWDLWKKQKNITISVFLACLHKDAYSITKT